VDDGLSVTPGEVVVAVVIAALVLLAVLILWS